MTGERNGRESPGLLHRVRFWHQAIKNALQAQLAPSHRLSASASAHFVFVKKFFSPEELKRFHARGLGFRARIFKFSISTNTEKAMAK
jgi:hypothetical protein